MLRRHFGRSLVSVSLRTHPVKSYDIPGCHHYLLAAADALHTFAMCLSQGDKSPPRCTHSHHTPAWAFRSFEAATCHVHPPRRRASRNWVPPIGWCDSTGRCTHRGAKIQSRQINSRYYLIRKIGEGGYGAVYLGAYALWNIRCADLFSSLITQRT